MASVPDNQPTLTQTRRTQIALAAVPAGLVLAVYAQTYRHGFVEYDDPGYVSENAVVRRGLTLYGARWAFTTGLLGNWNPLTWLSYMLDVQLFGADAGALHLVNVALHLVNTTLLLFAVLLRMTRALAPASPSPRSSASIRCMSSRSPGSSRTQGRAQHALLVPLPGGATLRPRWAARGAGTGAAGLLHARADGEADAHPALRAAAARRVPLARLPMPGARADAARRPPRSARNADATRGAQWRRPRRTGRRCSGRKRRYCDHCRRQRRGIRGATAPAPSPRRKNCRSSYASPTRWSATCAISPWRCGPPTWRSCTRTKRISRSGNRWLRWRSSR